jgi:dihydroorotase (homodimeric type)
MRFEPLMTLYLTDNTDPGDVAHGHASGIVKAVKYYPAGATTNSDSGVSDIRKVDGVLEAMQEIGMPLLLHGEVTDPEVDIFDREAVFIDRVLTPLLQPLPRLKVVLEHITTRQAAEFVAAAPANVAATITAHHLLYNRNAMFQGGMRPHYYCLPVLKRETHRHALVEVAISGNPKFFLGTDSAPHSKHAKETACGCAGIYTAHAALELYAEAFELAGALDGWKVSPVFTVRISTACRAIRNTSHCGVSRHKLPSNTFPAWCRCAPAKLWPGECRRPIRETLIWTPPGEQGDFYMRQLVRMQSYIRPVGAGMKPAGPDGIR